MVTKKEPKDSKTYLEKPLYEVSCNILKGVLSLALATSLIPTASIRAFAESGEPVPSSDAEEAPDTQAPDAADPEPTEPEPEAEAPKEEDASEATEGQPGSDNDKQAQEDKDDKAKEEGTSDNRASESKASGDAGKRKESDEGDKAGNRSAQDDKEQNRDAADDEDAKENQAPTIRVTRVVDDGNGNEVEVDVDSGSDSIVTNKAKVVVYVTDEEASLNTAIEASHVRVTHTSFGADAPDDPATEIALTQEGDSPSVKKAELALDEGVNAIEISAADSEGKSADAWSRVFVFDAEGPVVKLNENSGGQSPVGGTDNVYNSRTMTLTIEDNTSVNTSSLQVYAYRDGVKDPMLMDCEWQGDGTPQASATLSFTEEGTYTKLVVTGADGIGNPIDAAVSEKAFTKAFSINLKPSVSEDSISVATEDGARGEVYGGKTYYRDDAVLTVTVPDSDLDASNSKLIEPSGVSLNWQQQNDGSWKGSANLNQGIYDTIRVKIVDTVGNAVEIAKDANIVIDSVAPAVKKAIVNSDPVNTMTSSKDGDLEVFNATTSVELQLTDGQQGVAGGLSSVELVGTNTDKCTLTVDPALKGAAQSSATITIDKDGELIGRTVLVKVTDLAGNYRIWSIAKDGKVLDNAGKTEKTVDNQKLEDKNANLYAVYPFALVVDKEPPTILLNIDGDEVVARSRELSLDIEENNFDLLRQYDASQAIVTVSRLNDLGVDDGKPTVITVGDKAIMPMDPDNPKSYSGVFEFSKEGDYVANATIRDIAGQEASFGPLTFSIDYSAPIIEILNVADGEFSNDASREVTIQVTERNFDADKTSVSVEWTSPNGRDSWTKTLAELVEPGVDWKSEGKGNKRKHTIPFSIGDEGTYKITATTKDKGGKSGKTAKTITLDRTAPLMSVEWDNNDAHNPKGPNPKYYNAPRTATVTVVEASWKKDGFADLEVRGGRRSEDKIVASGWEAAGEDEDSGLPKYQAVLAFKEDATYPSITISGVDLAGNDATVDPAETNPRPLVLPSFTIDTVSPEPRVELTSKKAGVYDKSNGITYFRHPVKATTTILDRNFDPKSSIDYKASGKNAGKEESKLHKVSTDDDAVETWVGTGTYGQGSYVHPVVRAVDYATNEKAYDAQTPFVVDLEAPEVTEVTVKNDATYSGIDEDGERRFYQPTTSITIKVSDNFRINRGVARLDDPEDIYDRPLKIDEDRLSGSVTVDLVDGTTSHATEFDRYPGSKIVLTVEDVAGNVRTWSIARDGTVTQQDDKHTVYNLPINNQKDKYKYPLALIHDGTRPLAALSGVDAGVYYNTDQTVTATITELNFEYLRHYEGSREVMHVRKQEGNAGRAESITHIPAEEFGGNDPLWSHSEPFNTDGHYVVWIDFLDIANNPSETPRIEEFTIDKTAPVLSVVFDNNDVRNGKYFNAYRTATITVEEHNFDPSLFSIDTNGSIGGWSSNGDTHTCLVFFASDGVFNLSVSGKDMAGNEAVSYTEPEFVIDTQAPTITFGGIGERLGMGSVLDEATNQDGETEAADNSYRGTIEDRGAYNGVVAPSIEFKDEQNYDTMGWSMTLVGNKVGDVSESYPYGVQDGSNAQTLSFSDFGLKDSYEYEEIEEGQEESQTKYDVNADDIYTIHATLKDLAGNEVQGDIVFSVNRFGSNYLVSMKKEGSDLEYALDEEMLSDAPHIVAREINVSGVDSESGGSWDVSKEYANNTTDIPRDGENDPDEGEGYRLSTPGEGEAMNNFGWSEYIYSIRAANFGAKTEEASERGEGQGLYRVNISSDDTASNGNNTAEYWSSSIDRGAVEAKVGTVEFVLDEQGPVIDNVDMPNSFVVGNYEASFHVTDTLSSNKEPNEIEVVVDGKPAEFTELGDGSYSFVVPAKSFAWHDVSISVKDYAGRSDRVTNSGSYLTQLYPELLIALGILAGVGAATFIVKKRREEAEPEQATRRTVE